MIMTKTEKNELRRLALGSARGYPLGVLASVGKTGEPHAAAIWMDIDDDFTVRFLTRVTTNKAADLKQNKRVSLAFNFSGPVYIQLSGTAHRITNGERRSLAIDRLAKAIAGLGNTWPMVMQIGKGDYVVHEIDPDSVRAFDLRNLTVASEATRAIDLT